MAQNRGISCTNARRHARRSVATSAATTDPFGEDGFGDTWQKQDSFGSDTDYDPSGFISFDEDPDGGWDRAFSSADRDRVAKEVAADAHRATAAAEAKVAAAAVAAIEQKHAEERAKACQLVKERRVAKDRWDEEVDRVHKSLALAKPMEALDIIFSLFEDALFIEHIDKYMKDEMARFYQGLKKDYTFKQSLLPTESVPTESSTEESSNGTIDESTEETGGDTVKVASFCEESSIESEYSSGYSNATIVVDRRHSTESV